MTGSGHCTPDPTEGITLVEDLPEPKILHRSRNFKRHQCPWCGPSAYRDKVYTHRLHDLGDRADNARVVSRIFRFFGDPPERDSTA